jgi:hypothetical protein
LLRLALQHGKKFAKVRDGDRLSGRIESHGDFIKDPVAEQGDIALVETQALSTERGAPGGIGKVHRFFAPNGNSVDFH